MTFAIVLLVSDTNNLINIEHLVHPHLQVRNLQYATLCRRAYQACIGICLVVWLAFLVVSSRSDTQYTNGYVELATMVLSGLGQVVIKHLVTSTVRVRTVQKNCAITAVAWLAKRHPLAAAGVPPQLLALRENEEALINALFQHQQTQSQTIIVNEPTQDDGIDMGLWAQVPRCNRVQVEEDGDGPRQVNPRAV